MFDCKWCEEMRLEVIKFNREKSALLKENRDLKRLISDLQRRLGKVGDAVGVARSRRGVPVPRPPMLTREELLQRGIDPDDPLECLFERKPNASRVPLAGVRQARPSETLGVQAALVRAPEGAARPDLGNLCAWAGDFEDAERSVSRGGTGSSGVDSE